MISYNRAAYLRRSLPRLLDTCDDTMRVWVWHNGSDAETLRVARSFEGHPRLHRFHHSPDNVGLRVPTNWLWRQATGRYLAKVDDDCLVSDGWAQRLVAAHEHNPGFGAIACWHFQEEDFNEELARPKIRRFEGGHSLLVNFWVQGSGYVMKRTCVDEAGELAERQTFTQYCIALALRGYTNGWLLPFVLEEHMDDPRAAHTLVRSDEDLLRHLPLSAQRTGRSSVAAWDEQIRESARTVQTASIDPRDYTGWRVKARRLMNRLPGR